MVVGILILIFAALMGLFYYFVNYILNIFEFFGIKFSKEKLRFIKPLMAFASICICLKFTALIFVFLHIIVFSAILEIVRLILKKSFNKKDKDFDKSIYNKVYKCGIIPLVLTIAVSIIGYINMNDLHKTTYDVVTDKNIKKDYKAIFISDIHYGNVFDSKNIDDCVEKLNNEDSDFIILGGDIVDDATSKEQMEEIFKKLGSVKNKKGIYYIFGNHDTRSKNFTYDDLKKQIKDSGINILEDDTKVINKELVIAGKKDKSQNTSDEKRKENDQLLKDVDKKNFVLLADHQPCEYEKDSKGGIDLELSGHTHGGQVFPIGYICELFGINDKIYGYEKRGDFNVIVSSGAAGWGFPFRTEHHSEYVVVNIKGK